MGFGPTTSTLARLRSTPELYPHHLRTGYLITHKKIKCKNFFHIFVKKFQIIFKMFIKQDFTRLFEFNFLLLSIIILRRVTMSASKNPKKSAQQLRFEKEAKALQKNLQKRKKQQEELNRRKLEKEQNNG